MSLFPVEGPAGPLTGLYTGTMASGAGTPLVLLHGIQGAAQAWSGVVDALPDALPVVVPNLRGRAGSPVPESVEEYSLDRFAADLAAVLTALDRPAVIAGWSMGVLVALAYARGYGLDRVRGLVLIGGTAAPGDECRWFKGDTPEAIAAEADARARALALRESASPIAVAGAWLSARTADFRDHLAHIDVPTLVIHGTDDDQCPLSHGQLIAERIPGARLEALVDGTHNLPSQAAAPLAGHLAGFHHDIT